MGRTRPPQLRKTGLGRVDRFLVWGLSRSDITDYLPVDEFVSQGGSWQDLRDEHSRLRVEAKKGMRPANDFKRWLELNYKADFGDEVLRTACRSLDAVPEEFEQLVAVLEKRG